MQKPVRIIVSVGLFVLIFRTVDLREVLEVLKASNPWLLFPALGLQILSARLLPFAGI